MHQRQAHHAILGVESEIIDQAVGVKMTILGAYALRLQFRRQQFGALPEWREGDGRRAIIIFDMRLADQAYVVVVVQKFEYRRSQLIFLLQDQGVNIGQYRCQ